LQYKRLKVKVVVGLVAVYSWADGRMIGRHWADNSSSLQFVWETGAIWRTPLNNVHTVDDNEDNDDEIAK